MPCTYYETPEEKAAPFNKLRDELDDVTRMLCGVMTILEREGNSFVVKNQVPGLPEWWEKHKKSDTKRRIAELQAEIDKLKGSL